MKETEFFNSIQNHFSKNLPFVLFKKPNEDRIIAFLQPNANLNSSDSFTKNGFVFSPFTSKSNLPTVWFYENECKTIETNFRTETFDYNLSKSLLARAKDEHLNRVKKAIEQIKLKELQKVIISRVEEQIVKNIDPITWFKKCITFYPDAFSYCWFHPKIGLWLGATPETLILLEENKFYTMALAGTMPYKGDLNVEWGEKEIVEQQLVVDSIIRGLKSVATNIDKSDTKTHKAGSLLHLKTEIKGNIVNNDSFKVLLQLLHPTSAVCGLPQEESKNYISENEGYDRKYYTGFLGAFNANQKTELFVNLRCLEIEKLKAKIYVGGGITAQSNPEKEWEETVNKTMTMKKIIS